MKLLGSWIWYELMTPDAAASKAFYENVVGWKFETSDPHYGFLSNPDGGMTGGVLTLTSDMQAHGARPAWVGYIGTDDCDATVKAIEAKGGKLLMPARDIDMAGRIAMVADCCGAPFYVMTPKPPAGDGPKQSTAFSPSLQGRCSWNELMAADVDKALDFYTSIFGWTLPPAMDMGPAGKYHFIQHGDVVVGGAMRKPDEAPVSAWNFYFRVASIEGAAAVVKSSGGQVVMGPHQVPTGEWILVGIDPQGAVFALVGGK